MRPKFFQRGMLIAEAVALGSTCPKAQVGCVLVDKNKSIIGTGYNGVPRGFNHCTEIATDTNHISFQGTCNNLASTKEDSCLAIHAEINALMHCKNIQEIKWVFCTKLPCYRCAKALINTPMEVLITPNYTSNPEVLQLFEVAKIKLITIGD